MYKYIYVYNVYTVYDPMLGYFSGIKLFYCFIVWNV